MGIERYKVFAKAEYDTMDKSNIEEVVRWNLDGTQFIVEYTSTPMNVTTLSREEARQLVCNPEWTDDTDE